MELTPFLTTATFTAEMTAADWEAECRRLFRRNRAIADLLTGDGSVDRDYLYDLLAEDSIDPYAWEEMAIDNIDHIISSQ